jgi:hypothetical protein
VLRNDPFPYSIISQTVVEVYVITKQDLLTKITKDIRDLMESKASSKLEWIKKRLIEICLGIENIAMWDNI